LAVCHIKDINGAVDYVGTGFKPDLEISPLSSVGGVKPFGDPEETMLAVALNAMNQ